MPNRSPGKPENFTRDQSSALRTLLRELSQRRDIRGLPVYPTQTALADAVGMAQQNVSRLLSHKDNSAGLTYGIASNICHEAGYMGVDAFFEERGLGGLPPAPSGYHHALAFAIQIAKRLEIPERIIAAVIERAGGPQTPLRTRTWVDRFIVSADAEEPPTPPASSKNVASDAAPKPERHHKRRAS